MVGELQRRAALEHDGDVLDYAADWVGNGQTLVSLAEDISKSTKQQISRPMLSKYLNGVKDTATDTLSRAREDGAEAIVEKLRAVVESTPATRDDIARTKLQMDMDLWLAERWNKRAFGQAKGAQVNITVGNLVLEALRSPTPAIEASAAIIPAILPGVDDATDVTIES